MLSTMKRAPRFAQLSPMATRLYTDLLQKPEPVKVTLPPKFDQQQPGPKSLQENLIPEYIPTTGKTILPNLQKEVPTKTLSAAHPVSHGELLDVEKMQDDMVKLALPFDEVPGPKILATLSKVWELIPVIGRQLTASSMVYFMSTIGSNMIWNSSTWSFNKMFDHYGPVVRVHGPLGGNIVFLNRPEHIEAVYQQEGRYPVRSSLDSVEEYRLRHRRLRMAGPFIMSGPEWKEMRSKVEAPMQKSVLNFFDGLEDIAQSFISRIQTIRNPQEEVPKDFQAEIRKWSLESVCQVAFGKRLGCLDSNMMSPGSESQRLLSALHDAVTAVAKCESGLQWWRFVETRSWQRLVASCDAIDVISSKYIRVAQNRLRMKKDAGAVDRVPPDPSLLEALLLAEDMLPEDVLTVVLDSLLIGVNASSHAMCFLLYHLAKSPRIQRELFEEISAMMPLKSSELEPEMFQHTPLLRACVKESLRLNPPIPVMTRVLPKDIALHSYKIPKGTLMLMTSHVACLREENFEDALRFKPERWMTGEVDVHPFASIPFGHGARSCVGRTLAELQLYTLTAKLVRNFRVEYHYGEMKAPARLLSMPDKPLKFRFVDRNV